jgi:hypothetical protein
MMYWQWEKGRPVMRSHESTNDGTVSLTCQDTTEPRVTIKNTSTDEATRILGVYISPTEDYTKQIQILKQKADQMAINLHASRLTATETNTFLKTPTYAPSMRYALPALAIDEERINEVQTKLLGVSLQKLGMSSKTPTAIRHGPITMGGLGMIDLRTELGISTIKLLCDNVYNGSEVGKLILIAYKYQQIEAGICEPLLAYLNIHLPYITATWLMSIRQFLYNHNMTINVTDTLTIRLHGKGDECIMAPSRLRGYTATQQMDINLVRLHLQVITLSDMSQDYGTHIHPNFLEGTREPSRKIRHNWPQQEEPT